MNFSQNRADQIGITIIITLVVLILFLLSLIFGWGSVNSTENIQSTITVSGEGQAFAVPDTATFTYTVRGEGETAEAAQAQISDAAAQVLSAMQAEGVEDTDIKTQSYNVFPRYEYRQARATDGLVIEGQRVLVGYEATQTNQVRVRSVDNAGNLLGLATSAGADDVSSLDFIVWDETAVEAEARSEAIADAKQKAEALADQLGVTLGDITDFYENEDGYYPQPFEARVEMMEMDAAGGAMPAEISLGENEVRKNVSITFEIK